MKVTQYIFALMLAGALVSCGKTEGPDVRDGRIAFRVGAAPDIHVATKATDVTTSTLSTIYVSATTGTVGSAESEFWTSVNFTKGDDDVFRADKWWPLSDPHFHFYGANVPVTFAATGARVAATTETDVICAYLPSPTFEEPNVLSFSHVFAQVGTVSFSAPSPYALSDVTVLITPKVSGTYDIYAGYGQTDGTGWSGAADGPTASLNLSASNALYTIPGDYTLTVSYRLTVGDYTDTFTKSAAVSLAGGMVNNISGTVPQGAAESIIISTTLTPWSDNDIEVTGP